VADGIKVMLDETRGPKAPCTVVELSEAFRIEDADGRAVTYVYYATGARLSAILGSWTKDEARAIAQQIARGFSRVR
jgi:hypothetical protein